MLAISMHNLYEYVAEKDKSIGQNKKIIITLEKI